MATGITGSRCIGSGESTASVPINPTIHRTLSAALAFLEQVERSVYAIEVVLFGPTTTPTLADVKCAVEPPIDVLAIGLRVRLESLQEQLFQIHGRVHD